MQSADQWLKDHYGAEVFRAGLETLESFLAPRIQKILHSKTKIITIAGTNGKGETSFRLAQILKEEGKSYKLWTSPHILTVLERFQAGHSQISEQQLLKYFLLVEAEKLNQGIQLSYYEFLFSVFLYWVEEEIPDYLILEVGLGGRLDATVLLPPQLVLIPSISRDHQEYLGKTYRSILSEKLGIMDRAQKIQCFTSFETVYLRELTTQKLVGKSHQDLFSEGILQKCDDFSFRNTVLAIYALRSFEGQSLDQNQIFQKAQELMKVILPGRGERKTYSGKEFVFFGSHNPDGVRKLVQLLKSNNYTFNEIIISFSARDQRDLMTQLKLIGSLGKEKVILTHFSHTKAAPSELLEAMARKEGIRFVKEWANILHSDSTPCLVTGSYYFVGAVQSYLERSC